MAGKRFGLQANAAGKKEFKFKGDMVDVNSVFRGAQYYTASNDSDAVADLADKLTDQVRDHIRKMVRNTCSSTACWESLCCVCQLLLRSRRSLYKKLAYRRDALATTSVLTHVWVLRVLCIGRSCMIAAP